MSDPMEQPLRELIQYVMRRLDTLEWLACHAGARPLDDHPDWYIHIDREDATGSPFHRINLYDTRTGKTHRCYWEMMNPFGREGVTYDAIAREQLDRLGWLKPLRDAA